MSLAALNRAIMYCRKCPRLTRWRESVALEPPRRYHGQVYWAKPLAGFGDPEARLWVVGLAPAAHGGNRTGRMFTGDRSGDWVFGTLHKFGFASLPDSRRRDDGLTLHDAYITAALRCAPPANKPLPEELLSCRPYLVQELEMLDKVRVVVALGKIAFDAYLRACAGCGLALPSPRPQFGHGATYALADSTVLIGSYHPRQQNTQTGRLTRPM